MLIKSKENSSLVFNSLVTNIANTNKLHNIEKKSPPILLANLINKTSVFNPKESSKED